MTPPYDGTSNPWNISGDLKAGNTGAAGMTVSGGSKVVDVNAYLGYLAGSTANVLVSDSSSLWQNSGGLYIGGSRTQAGGTALLTITSGRVEANQTVIWGGGSLAGTGTLKSATVTNAGTISPGGGSIGTLTIDGNVTFQPTGILEVQVNNGGSSDKLVVTGNVSISGGTVKAISTETIVGAKQYTIVDANKVTGRFTVLDTALLNVDHGGAEREPRVYGQVGASENRGTRSTWGSPEPKPAGPGDSPAGHRRGGRHRHHRSVAAVAEPQRGAGGV